MIFKNLLKDVSIKHFKFLLGSNTAYEKTFYLVFVKADIVVLFWMDHLLELTMLAKFWVCFARLQSVLRVYDVLCFFQTRPNNNLLKMIYFC